MRDIKLRGFNHEIGWVYGMYVDGFIVDDVIEATDEYIALDRWCPVDIDSVGQCTGLKDKNGVEICEGDILLNKTIIHQPDGKLTTKIIGDIQILNGMTYLIGKTWQDVDGEDIRISEYKSLLLKPELFRIIGNIYENPDIRDNN